MLGREHSGKVSKNSSVTLISELRHDLRMCEIGLRSHWYQSRSQSFVPLDQRSENVSSGSNHYERTKEITEFWLSGSLRICIYGACLKWLLPELSFSDRWSRGTKLWERDCIDIQMHPPSWIYRICQILYEFSPFWLKLLRLFVACVSFSSSIYLVCLRGKIMDAEEARQTTAASFLRLHIYVTDLWAVLYFLIWE